MDPSYDLRTRTTLVCGALALAIALSVLLRGRVRRVHLLGAAFAGDLGMWYLSQSLFGFTQVPVWDKLRIVLAVLLPVFAVNLFEGMMPQERAARRRMPLGYVTLLLSVPMVALALSPKLQLFPVRVAIFLYVFTLFAAGLGQIDHAEVVAAGASAAARIGVLLGQILALLGAAGSEQAG